MNTVAAEPKTMFELIGEFTNARREQVLGPDDQQAKWTSAPSLWDLLLESTARGGGAGSAVQRSRPPISTEVLSLIAEIRSACEESLTLIGRKAIWQTQRLRVDAPRPDAMVVVMWRDIPAELRAVCAGASGLSDVRRSRWTDDLARWINRAKLALGEQVPRIQLPRGTRCLDCDTAWVTTKIDGEDVRRPALHLVWHDNGALYYVGCLACGKSRWPADLHALAEHQRQLNLEQETVAS